MGFLSALLRPWNTHSNLLMRGYGLLLLLSLVGRLHKKKLLEFVDTYPWCALPYLLLGIYVFCFGPNIFSVFFLLLGAIGYVWVSTTTDDYSGLTLAAAEYPLYVMYPLVSLLLLAVVYFVRGKGNKFDWIVADRVLVKFSKITVLMCLFFVAFHKYNHDFMNPDVSCGLTLHRHVKNNWDSPFLVSLLDRATPLSILIGESLLPFLLVLVPRIGIIAVTVTFSAVALVGAPSVTMSMIVLSLSFLSKRDLAFFRRYFFSLLSLSIFIALFVLIFSHAHYYGRRVWHIFAIHQTVCMSIVVFVTSSLLYHLWDDRSLSILKRLKKVKSDFSSMFFDKHKWITIALSGVALFQFINCVTPYLGLKFSYSFAMLSNLRVDDARWNHLIVPNWVMLKKHDDFLHVNLVSFNKRVDYPRVPFKGRDFRPSLISPYSFLQRLEAIQSSGAKMKISFDYKGKSYDFQDATCDPEFLKFVEDLPNSYKLIQRQLTLIGPQRCTH